MAEASKSSAGRGGSSRKKSSSGSRTSAAGSRSASSRSGAGSAKRRAAAKKGGQARGRQQTAQKRARKTATAATKPAEEFSGKSVADLREALTKNLIQPLNLVMLTRGRIEEVMGDAVSRGRVTADDAQDLVQGLVQRGRRETREVLRDLEHLLGDGGGDLRKRGGDAATRARKQVEDATTRARSAARRAADPVLAQADRARRTAGVGPSFPVSGYDDLSVAQVKTRLGSLTPAELRKVRDYERRNANRKTVLTDIESRLAG